MTFTIFASRQQAIDANRAEAEAHNCNMESTCEWWPRFDHPTDGRSALENGGPVNRSELENDGWFAINEED